MDFMRETVFVPRGWRWEPFAIYLLRSHHPGWDCLRAILREGSIYELVGDESRSEDGIAAVSKLHPEAILCADDLPELSIQEAARNVREVSPASKLVVVGGGSEEEFRAPLGESGADAVLPWERVTPLGVLCCLVPVLQDGWQVAPPAAAPEVRAGSRRERATRGREMAEDGRATPERRHPTRDEDLVLTHREREVLSGVAAGLESAQIAGQLEVSERTVRRIITDLEQKLGARNRAALAARAVERGLAP